MTKQTKEKSAESYLKAAHKAIEEAIGQGLDESELEHAKTALGSVAQALNLLVSNNDRKEKLAKIAELQASLDLAA